jgi:hypothetical protein
VVGDGEEGPIGQVLFDLRLAAEVTIVEDAEQRLHPADEVLVARVEVVRAGAPLGHLGHGLEPVEDLGRLGQWGTLDGQHGCTRCGARALAAGSGCLSSGRRVCRCSAARTGSVARAAAMP